ncbi:MAG: CbiX/SirB N-terminal domain-containing protein [Gammaproteobacteria bacterium]|nr:CbiX/SirB N-terminal domain-containing protein [Gammaproteobacteria bacterium]
MKALLLVAHGSRRTVSNIEIAVVATSLRKQVSDDFAFTRHAFLEIAQPSIPDAIDELIADGADDITVLCYFLSAGRHVREDVPAFVEDKRKQYPEVKLSLAPYLGQAPDLIGVLHRLAKV